MKQTVSPDAQAILKRADDAGLIMAHVLRRADVAKSTWWRIKQGREHFRSTIDRLNAAITEMIADPETVTKRRKNKASAS